MCTHNLCNLIKLPIIAYFMFIAYYMFIAYFMFIILLFYIHVF